MQKDAIRLYLLISPQKSKSGNYIFTFAQILLLEYTESEDDQWKYLADSPQSSAINKISKTIS